MTYKDLAKQLTEINKKMMKMKEYNKIIDSNRGEKVLLSYLAMHNGKATPVELSEALHVSTARIAVLINKLEQKQIVERQNHPDNKLNKIVKLLPKGEEINKQIKDDYNKQIIKFLETLSKEEAKTYVMLQQKLLEFIEKNMEVNNRE